VEGVTGVCHETPEGPFISTCPSLPVLKEESARFPYNVKVFETGIERFPLSCMVLPAMITSAALDPMFNRVVVDVPPIFTDERFILSGIVPHSTPVPVLQRTLPVTPALPFESKRALSTVKLPLALTIHVLEPMFTWDVADVAPTLTVDVFKLSVSHFIPVPVL
jgi:hypothetical protein